MHYSKVQIEIEKVISEYLGDAVSTPKQWREHTTITMPSQLTDIQRTIEDIRKLLEQLDEYCSKNMG